MSMPAASVKDMSAYAGGHLRFDIKTDYDIQIGIRSDNVDADANDAKKYISNYITLDGTRFQPVAIPIAQLVAAQSGTDLAQMKDLFIAAAVGRQINAQYSKTFLIDNIRWTLD
jgi:hypothetical protein